MTNNSLSSKNKTLLDENIALLRERAVLQARCQGLGAALRGSPFAHGGDNELHSNIRAADKRFLDAGDLPLQILTLPCKNR